MNIKDKLQKYADKPTLATSSPRKAVIVKSEIDKTINRIKNNLTQYQEIKTDIVRDLLFLKNHQDELKVEKGITFQEFIENELGMTKGHFYEQLQAYNLCLTYKDETVFNEVDTKILVKIARMGNESEQIKYFKNVRKLTRADFVKVRPSDSPKITVPASGKGAPSKQVNFENLIKYHSELHPLNNELKNFFMHADDRQYVTYNISNRHDAKGALIEYIEKMLREWK